MQNSKRYDLEDRTLIFAAKARDYVKRLPNGLTNFEISKQLFRAAGPVGANYIEANESLSRKDFILRVKISRKEAKEARYWLKLSEPKEPDIALKNALIQEVTELMRIFGAIIEKVKS
ncbi:four helix bundle protein [Candidatus Margulisiibacteriota bacterium]